MCEIIKEIINDELKGVALRMIDEGGFTAELIAKISKFPIEEIETLIEEHSLHQEKMTSINTHF